MGEIWNDSLQERYLPGKKKHSPYSENQYKKNQSKENIFQNQYIGEQYVYSKKENTFTIKRISCENKLES